MEKKIKQQIRKRHIRQRSVILEDIKNRKSAEICRNLRKFLEDHAKTEHTGIYGYYPFGKEVTLLDFYEWSIRHKIPLAFPRVSGDEMTFYQVDSMEEFEAGAFHIMEPVEGCRKAEFDRTFCLVPGTVFDRFGNRYGYGRGYYDRYFAGHRDIYRIGIAYEAQVEDQIPQESFDRKMHAIVTETGVYQMEEIKDGITGIM